MRLLCLVAVLTVVSAAGPGPSKNTTAPPLFANLLTMDCNGAVHLLYGSPLETNVNMPFLKTVWDAAFTGIVARAQAAWYVATSR
jgi:hypothetical protein